MRSSFLLLFLILSIFWMACTPQAPVPPKDPVGTGPLKDTTIKDMEYGSNKAQKFDLGLPANRTAATALVMVIHGGGWTTGDKSELSFMTDGLKLRGFAVANINYRLAPQSTDNYNMQLDDINAAIQFAFSKATEYSFNGQKIYLVGHSAGAHLALSYAYTRNNAGKVKAVGSMAGPTNLFYLAYYNPFPFDWQTGLVPLLNMPLYPITTASEARYKMASPLLQATAAAPPTIVFHGDIDPRVNIEQAGFLVNQLGTLGVDKKYIVYPLVFHDWWADIAKRDNTMDELKNWFNNHP